MESEFSAAEWDVSSELDALLPEPVRQPEKESPSLHVGHRGRMRKKFWEKGPENMTDSELMEMLIYYAHPRGDTTPLAGKLLERFGSVENVLFADVSELSAVTGVGESLFTFITILRLVTSRFHTPVKEAGNFTDPDFLEGFLPEQFRGFNKERLMIYGVDSEGRLLCKDMIMSGDFDSVRFEPERILHFLKKSEASAVVLAHNHPNGLCIPSCADLEATRKLCAFLNENSIFLVEHYVVAGEQTDPIIRHNGEDSFRQYVLRKDGSRTIDFL